MDRQDSAQGTEKGNEWEIKLFHHINHMLWR